MTNEIVALNKVTNYDDELLYKIIKEQFQALNIKKEDLENKNVVIKPNLVAARGPEKAATTHPALLKAVVKVLKEYSPSNLILAESFGGPYTELTLKNVYNATGISACAKDVDLKLNFDTSVEHINNPDDKTFHSFNIIKPIYDADVIINLCKLKAHSLMKMSCAIKNFFGVIPGVEKFETHARYPKVEDFTDMLLDLDTYLLKGKKIISICDGIVAMEGNGPTNGVPRKIDTLISSLSPFTLDVVAEYIIGFEGTILTTKMAQERNLAPLSINDINIIGDNIETLRVTDFLPPDSKSGKVLKGLSTFMGGKVAKFLEPRPKINEKVCVGCGKCVESCPVHTIKLVNHGNKKIAQIDKSICIRCFCCQELCPKNAVDIKKNIFIKLAH